MACSYKIALMSFSRIIDVILRHYVQAYVQNMIKNKRSRAALFSERTTLHINTQTLPGEETEHDGRWALCEFSM